MSFYNEPDESVEEDTCLMCIDSLEEYDTVTLTCGHAFHVKCVNKYFLEEDFCTGCLMDREYSNMKISVEIERNVNPYLKRELRKRNRSPPSYTVSEALYTAHVKFKNLQRLSQIKSTKLKDDQIRNDQIIRDQFRNDKIMRDQIRSDQLRNDQIMREQIRRDQIRNDQLIRDQIIRDQLMIDYIMNNQLRESDDFGIKKEIRKIKQQIIKTSLNIFKKMLPLFFIWFIYNILFNKFNSFSRMYNFN